MCQWIARVVAGVVAVGWWLFAAVMANETRIYYRVPAGSVAMHTTLLEEPVGKILVFGSTLVVFFVVRYTISGAARVVAHVRRA